MLLLLAKNALILHLKQKNECMKRISYVFLLFLVAVSILSCGSKESGHAEKAMVDVVEAKGLNEVDATTFTGKTKSAEEVNLAFRVAGQIERVLVKEGDYVSKGQVVAVMDSRDYQVQLSATQAEYAQVKADAERVMALYAEGNTTASNNDKARYGLQQITQKLANHKNQLDDTRLRSTISGYVQTKFHESGETVGAGMPVLSVFGSGDTEAEIKISASDFSNINKFTHFFCKFDVTGDESFPLNVNRVSQEANSSQLYTVRPKFSGNIDHKKITPGMTTMVYAEVSNTEATGMVRVPSSAVMEEDGKTQVFVYDGKTGKVSKRGVSVGLLNRDGTMVIESGLKAGEKVVATGVHHIEDGQEVSVLQKPAASNVGGLL